jgi:microcystin degradation protein MlrC
MMRIAIGGFLHETNTFSTMKATYDDFVSGGSLPALVRGQKLPSALAGINQGITGAMDVLRQHGHEAVPLIFASACPSSYVTDDAFERISAAMVSDLAAAEAVEGIYLDLHGAAVIESFDDGEGELLRRIRAVVGDAIPIVASLDLHANVSRKMVDLSDALIIYRTYPHVDMSETGARATRHLLALLQGSGGRRKAFRQVPFLLPLQWGCTLSDPGKSLYALNATLETGAGSSLSFACGFPAADIADCGPSVVAYARTQAHADDMADAMLAAIMAVEGFTGCKSHQTDDAVRLAMKKSAGATRPIILADTQDNPGGGANSDTVWLLESLVRHGARGAVVGVLFDPASAAACHAAGAGKSIHLDLGAVSGIPGHTPYSADYHIEKLGDGNFIGTGPMRLGLPMKFGPMALVETGGVRVVVGSTKGQTLDQSMFQHLGIDPAKQKILVVKSSVHFRADFQPIAEEILIVEAPGPMISDPSKLPFTRLRPGVRTSPMGKALRK